MKNGVRLDLIKVMIQRRRIFFFFFFFFLILQGRSSGSERIHAVRMIPVARSDKLYCVVVKGLSEKLIIVLHKRIHPVLYKKEC